jgi:protein-disulfide isomerase
MANRVVKAKDIVFSDGEIISSELFDLETGKSYKELMTPTLTSTYYDKAKFIAGNINAKDKLVIFSDPLCPFCIDFVPDVIKYVQKHEKNLALYYYHFPLTRIHPAAVPLSKLMILAKHKGIKDIEQKVYTIDWDKYFTSKETDVKKVLDGFNKEFKTSFSLKDLEDDKLEKELIYDINMGEEVMVDGTPTIFVNGEQDKTKLKYEQLGK